MGLGASGQDVKPYGWAESLLSIIFFAFGCLVFAKFAQFFGIRKRGVMAVSFFVQCVMVFISAGLTQGRVIDGQIPAMSHDNPEWSQLVPIILLSFQAAGQISAARNLSLNEVPTVVVTSLLYDMWSDPKLLAGLTENAKRNRRIAAFVLELVGAIAGGWVSKATASVSGALWIIGALKGAIFIAWMFWAKKD